MSDIEPLEQQEAQFSVEADLVQAVQIEALLQTTLEPSLLFVDDESWQHAGHAGANAQGRGSHFFVKISAPSFNGLRPVAQHRLIYQTLSALMPRIHALRIEVV